jgi:hypothetical protein
LLSRMPKLSPSSRTKATVMTSPKRCGRHRQPLRPADASRERSPREWRARCASVSCATDAGPAGFCARACFSCPARTPARASCGRRWPTGRHRKRESVGRLSPLEVRWRRYERFSDLFLRLHHSSSVRLCASQNDGLRPALDRNCSPVSRGDLRRPVANATQPRWLATLEILDHASRAPSFGLPVFEPLREDFGFRTFVDTSGAPPVPEPGTAVLFGTALLTVWRTAVRSRR